MFTVCWCVHRIRTYNIYHLYENYFNTILFSADNGAHVSCISCCEYIFLACEHKNAYTHIHGSIKMANVWEDQYAWNRLPWILATKSKWMSCTRFSCEYEDMFRIFQSLKTYSVLMLYTKKIQKNGRAKQITQIKWIRFLFSLFADYVQAFISYSVVYVIETHALHLPSSAKGAHPTQRDKQHLLINWFIWSYSLFFRAYSIHSHRSDLNFPICSFTFDWYLL